MKKTFNLLVITILLLLAFITSPVQAQDPQPGNTISGDQVIIGNSFSLQSNETLEGSLLIIGSASGVTVMGLEKIPFSYYLKRFSPLAFLGYLAGAGVFFLVN